MIKTKCVRDAASLHDGLRVLVTRTWPRGVPKEHVDSWWNELAPSAELLADWRQERITWAEYEERYRQEMDLCSSRVREFGVWCREAFKHGVPVTLLCVEREPKDPENPTREERCHRHILKAVIEGG